jgi:hypothetical protein
MLQFYVARVFSYLVARMILSAVWLFQPKLLTRWIEFNGWWVRKAMDYGIAEAQEPWKKIIRSVLWATDKVGDSIQLFLRWRVSADVRDHVEVLAKAFFTPGGWLMLGELTFVIFTVTRVWQTLRRRRRARRKAERAASKEKTPTVRTETPTRLPQAPQLQEPPH